MPDPDSASGLTHWDAISDTYKRSAILIGNGASINIHAGFAYTSLFDVASEGTVCNALGIDSDPIVTRYRSIRRTLIEAIHAVHPRHSDIDPQRLADMQVALAHYSGVFTTNYDLLIYWAVQSDEELRDRQFRDFFWNEDLKFDRVNVGTSDGRTRLYFLHGAFHIFELPDGTTVKASGARVGEFTYTPLLDLTFEYMGADLPLFVSEGSSSDKFVSIGRSDYLNYCYTKFAEHVGRFVVFGHSLSSQDDHLLRAMKGWIRYAERVRGGTVSIAIGVRPGSSEQINARMDEASRLLSGAELTFFDATSHPLGR